MTKTEAWLAVVNAIDGLSDEDKLRVLMSAMAFYDLKIPVG